MKKLHLKKISETAKKITSWLNKRKETDELNVPDYLKGYEEDEAEHDWKLLYYAVKGKIFDGEPIEDIYLWYNDERQRIIDKYGVETDNLKYVEFKDIYNGDYLITQQARTGHCDGEIIQKEIDNFYDEDYEEMHRIQNLIYGVDEAIIRDLKDFEDPNDIF